MIFSNIILNLQMKPFTAVKRNLFRKSLNWTMITNCSFSWSTYGVIISLCCRHSMILSLLAIMRSASCLLRRNADWSATYLGYSRESSFWIISMPTLTLITQSRAKKTGWVSVSWIRQWSFKKVPLKSTALYWDPTVTNILTYIKIMIKYLL